MKQTIRRITHWILADKMLQVSGFIFSILVVVFSLASSYTLRILIDDVFVGGNRSLLWTIQFIFLGLLFFQLLFTLVKSKLFFGASNRVLRRLRREVVEKLFCTDYSSIQVMQKGDIISKFNYDIDGVERVLSQGLPEFVSSVVAIVFTLGVMCYLHLPLTLLTLVAYPPLILVFLFLQRKVQKHSANLQKSRSKTNSILSELLTGIMTVRNFSIQNHVREQMDRSVTDMQSFFYRYRFIMVVMNLSSWMLIMVPFQAIMYGVAGSWYFSYGMPTIGLMLVFANYTNSMIGPVLTIVNFFGSLSYAKVCIARIDELLELPEETMGTQLIPPLTPASVKIKDLTFRFGEQAIFERFDMQVMPNSLTVICGSSGKGKSTLLKLLGRFYSYNEGSIKIGGLELCDINIDSLRSYQCYVPQDIFLFHDSVLNNVILYDESITIERAKEALCQVGLECYIDSEELVGESGEKLSGGEKRRIGLARALTRQPKMIMLDEPTSELDMNNVKNIVSLLAELKHQYTIVVSTHEKLLQDVADWCVDLEDKSQVYRTKI